MTEQELKEAMEKLRVHFETEKGKQDLRNLLKRMEECRAFILQSLYVEPEVLRRPMTF